MQAVGLISRGRLARIPKHLRFAHELAFFLHDETVRMLVEVEAGQGDMVQHTFKNAEQAEAFQRAAEAADPISALLSVGLPAKAKRVVCNRITMAMVSDCMHHIYEGLRCLEKRKVVVAFNLFRKPLKDSLVYLCWQLGDESGFYDEFMSGDPDKLTAKRTGNRRQQILQSALDKTDVSDVIEVSRIIDILFNAKNDAGLELFFQHAVHLVTVDRPELKTSPQNFNFIFKDYGDDDVYDLIYAWLPYVLLFLSHVVLGLFKRMARLEKGAVSAFIVRSKSAYLLSLEGVDAWVSETLGQTFSGDCGACGAPIKITRYNAARINMCEQYRCPRCGRVSAFPFSWMF